MRTICVRLDDRLASSLKAAALVEQESKSAFIRRAIDGRLAVEGEAEATERKNDGR